MNFYLFVPQQYNDVSDNTVWHENLYSIAVWDTSEASARNFVKTLHPEYNVSCTVRYIPEPKNLSITKNKWDEEFEN